MKIAYTITRIMELVARFIDAASVIARYTWMRSKTISVDSRSANIASRWLTRSTSVTCKGSTGSKIRQSTARGIRKEHQPSPGGEQLNGNWQGKVAGGKNPKVLSP